MIQSNKKPYIFDYVIFGSGAAGSTLANELSVNNTVALIDISKKKNSDNIDRSVPSFINKFSKNYTPTTSGVFGGNTELWSGKTYLITKEEVKEWPINHSELYKYSQILAEDLNICHDDIFSIEKIDNKASYHKSQRNILGNLFECFNLEFNQNVKCFENSSLKNIFLEENRIVKINIDKDKKTQEIHINNSLILCCGGLGNIPIYRKCLEHIIPIRDLPNSYKLSDHPHFLIGKIDSQYLTRIRKGYLKNNIKDKNEECILVFGKSTNYAFQIDGYKVGINFFLNLSRQSRNIFISKLSNFIHNIHQNFLMTLYLIFKGESFKSYRSIEVFAEEQEKSESKIVISNKVWRNKMKKINIDYQDPEFNFEFLQKELNKYTHNKLKKFKKAQISNHNIYTGLHPSCSTPFKKNPKTGEINTNLQIKGFKNLYILGTNVFPTNGVTNPTWTLMTLAKRLASYLKEENEQKN